MYPWVRFVLFKLILNFLGSAKFCYLYELSYYVYTYILHLTHWKQHFIETAISEEFFPMYSFCDCKEWVKHEYMDCRLQALINTVCVFDSNVCIKIYVEFAINLTGIKKLYIYFI